jgi:hypothetical protein
MAFLTLGRMLLATDYQMPTPFDEQPDLNLVSAYLVARGLSTERFSQAETQSEKTPDFRIRRGEAMVAYCEVKSPNDPRLNDLLRNAPPGMVVGGAKPDPRFNRLARLLEKADSQFMAVNPSQSELNILAYVNHDAASRFSDLYETLTGYFLASDGMKDGTKFSTVRHIASGRIGEAKRRIDLFLWFKGATGFMSGAVFNDADPERIRRVCALLGFDQGAIR